MKRNLKQALGIVISSVTLVSAVAGQYHLASALSSAFTTTKSEVTVGETFRASVTLRDVASWNVHIWPTGPVEGCTLDSANVSDDATNLAEKNFTVDCMATGTGSIILTLSGEITDEEQVETRLSGTSTVLVLAPVEESAQDESKTEPLPIGTPAETSGETPSGPSGTDAETSNSSTAPAVAMEVIGEAGDQSGSSEENTENEPDEDAEEEADRQEQIEAEPEESPRRTMVVASGSTTNNRIKSALVVALAVIATMVGCIEVYVILSSHRKERLQKLREKAQTLHVATTTMQLAQAMEKK